MKQKTCMLMVALGLLFPAGPVFSGPVGNPHESALLARLWESLPTPSLITTAFYDEQVNYLPGQTRRFPWTNPSVSPPEERHYPQTRSSKNTLSVFGVKLGFPIKDKAVVYGIAGSGTADIDFHYEDWTVGRTFKADDSFASGLGTFYGIGATFIMHDGVYENNIPFRLSMDMSYRRYEMADNRLEDSGTAYECTLDEIQLAFILSAQMETFSPYAGVKVASITGHESYTNTNYNTDYYESGYIDYEDDITWSKDIGYFAGITKPITRCLSVNLEWRGGDEQGMGAQISARF